MSAPNPSTHEPEAIYEIELNGPANIITHVRDAQAKNVPLDSGYLIEQAQLFISYVRRMERGWKPAWHDHISEAAKAATVPRKNRLGTIQIIKLRGELNLEDILKVRNLINEYMKSGAIHIIVELTEATHVHLSGIPVLVERADRLREYGGDLKLVGLSQYLRHIIDLSGASSRFDFCATEEEAVSKFQKEVL